MGYVIAAVLVILLVGGFVLLLVRNATRKSNLSDADDPGADQNSLGILGSDSETPLGDTSEHSESDGPTFEHEPDHDPATTGPAVDGGEAEGRRSWR